MAANPLMGELTTEAGGIYERLGVRRIVNAAGPVTRLGGHRLAPEVTAAMAEAAQACVQIDELQSRAGEILAAATGAEAGLVTTGAAGALLLGTAACLAGFDLERMDSLPLVRDGRNEVVVQRGHRNAYDHAIRAAGAQFVEVGYLGAPGAGCHYPWQIEAAISSRTVAIACPIMTTPGTVPLPEVVNIAHRHGLPVIVDAAATLPPRANLRRFIAEGADLVAYSGGKAIGGPQGSGILVGRRDAIESARLQMLDMDVYPQIWRAGRDDLRSGRLLGPPHHGIGRSCKVGKEQIVGLLVALERYLAYDEEAELAAQAARVYRLAEVLDGVRGVRCTLTRPDGGIPRAEIWLDEEVLGMTAYDVVNALEAGDLPICVSQGLTPRGGLVVNPSTLADGEERVVAERLLEVLRDGR
ncbi:MAG: aminotransferase class V-fold PLP-dependent enzyme [Chloroflexi bacterium]|nr:aminotransferase class V-fold PLP-dependent enzyme [Chloroflexota bacterium]